MISQESILNNRIEKAKEQLRSLINEIVHRQHGCNYPEIDIEDLDEVINILNGKD